MSYLYSYFVNPVNVEGFFTDLTDLWARQCAAPCEHTIIRHDDKIFIDGIYNEGVGYNQYVLNLVIYTEPFTEPARKVHHADPLHRFTVALAYDRIHASAQCMVRYAHLLEGVINKVESICRIHKLRLLVGK